MTVTSPWTPRPATTGVRILDLRLPTTSSDTAHYVDLMTDDDVDLADWRIQWRPSDASADWRDYHVAATVGRTLVAGTRVRIFGGATTGSGIAGFGVWFGGLVGMMPTNGVIVRLLDDFGQVVHERAAMAAGTDIPCSIVPDGDLTRAYVMPSVRSKGWWHLTMTFVRDLGPGEPVLSVAGDSSAEAAWMGLPVL